MFARLYNLVTILVAVSLVSVLLVEPIAALPKLLAAGPLGTITSSGTLEQSLLDLSERATDG